jgi:hypothetical protein
MTFVTHDAFDVDYWLKAGVEYQRDPKRSDWYTFDVPDDLIAA